MPKTEQDGGVNGKSARAKWYTKRGVGGCEACLPFTIGSVSIELVVALAIMKVSALIDALVVLMQVRMGWVMRWVARPWRMAVCVAMVRMMIERVRRMGLHTSVPVRWWMPIPSVDESVILLAVASTWRKSRQRLLTCRQLLVWAVGGKICLKSGKIQKESF